MNALTKNIAIISVGTVVCIAMVIWLVMPALKNVHKLNDELVAKKTEESNLQKQILAYQTAEADLNRASDKQKILDAILTQETMVTVIKEVENAVKVSGSTDHELTIEDPFLATVKPQNQKGGKPQPPVVTGLSGVVPVPYRLNLINNYTGIINLFSYMEHLPHFTEFSSFQLSAEVLESSAKDQLPVHTGRVLGNIDGVFFAKKDAEASN